MLVERLVWGLLWGLCVVWVFFFMTSSQQIALRPLGLVLSGINNRENYFLFPAEARR